MKERRVVVTDRMQKRYVYSLTRPMGWFQWYCRPRQRQALLHWAYDSRRIR